MRLFALCAAVIIALLPVRATAHGMTYPIRDPVLTANKLYSSGIFHTSRCPERKITRNSITLAKRYMSSVLDCLNASWGAHFKRAGLPFSVATIGFTTTRPRKFCGLPWGHIAARYCADEQRMLVRLNDSLLADPSDLFLFQLVAHEYGHHVQNITGIRDAYDRHPYRNESELQEQSRRKELQAECLSGLFVGSVWASLDKRGEEDWKKLLKVTRDTGDEGYKIRSHGKGRNLAAWLDKGFRASSPAACNTWTAPSSKVS
ncbi:YpfJ protein, zinc metalloprotease superfamily [[Actinomadura] parvosata subsp. kistnae]|uniref:Metalloprotease n=1 Tax=[Actinomadura] parvosata subsp. kistnae TaxID=1909395 RepID=A0A1V0A2G3_9ACTN|nr:neutral zinc metallopeptidase [Nonomuraea sp. ATCC 55076]AQZ64411.1 hypothetical protein BKM31_25745 [Nonomuraea sp. ATCC 55076]SPL89201.1 YpfJ protein, zinc metalloprotease superfamily [Actinomadura parvosata subsp. kistnae]